MSYVIRETVNRSFFVTDRPVMVFSEQLRDAKKFQTQVQGEQCLSDIIFIRPHWKHHLSLEPTPKSKQELDNDAWNRAMGGM